MKTNFTRFRYVLAAALCCLVSMGVWGAEKTIEGPIKISGYLDNENLIYCEQVKGGSTAPNINYPERIYANNLLTITAENTPIVNIKITYESSSYANVNQTFEIGNSSTSTVPSISSSTATSKTFSFEQQKGYTFFKLKPSAQTRISSIAITYIESSLIKPDFYFSEILVNATIGQNFVAPQLINNSTGSISYASSNQNIAQINPTTGEVKILSDGTTTITASVDATDTHQAAQASYDLTVIDPNKIILLSTNIQDWTETSGTSYVNGTYTNNKTGIIVDGSCMIRKNGNPTGPTDMAVCSEGYIQVRDTKPAGIIVIPSFSNVKSIELNMVAGTDTRTVKLYDGNILLETFSVTKIGTTFKYIVPEAVQSNEFNFIIKDQNGALYITDINVIGVPAKPTSTTNANGIMTLTGPWAAADLSALDLTDSTITGIDMTGITVPADAPALTPANPNCLIHVVNNTPESWKNVVSEDIALDINLQDGNNFYNSKTFETAEATYTRTFAKGWNTFSLPFDATVAAGDVVEEFDSKTETSIKFKTATSIKANQAYLINIAEDNTLKTFTSADAVVPITASTGEVFKSNFTKLTGTDAAGKYILVVQEGKEVFAPASENATVAAFRGYLDLSTQPSPTKKFTIEHDGGATNIDDANAESGMKIYSENGALVIYTNEIQNVQIYGLDGLMVRNIQLSEGNNTINGLAKGIYLINNQKAIVK